MHIFLNNYLNIIFDIELIEITKSKLDKLDNELYEIDSEIALYGNTLKYITKFLTSLDQISRNTKDLESDFGNTDLQSLFPSLDGYKLLDSEIDSWKFLELCIKQYNKFVMMCYIKEGYTTKFEHTCAHICKVRFCKSNFCRCGTDCFDFLNLSDEILKVPNSSDRYKMIDLIKEYDLDLVCSLDDIRNYNLQEECRKLHFIGLLNLGNTSSHRYLNDYCDGYTCDENTCDEDGID